MPSGLLKVFKYVCVRTDTPYLSLIIIIDQKISSVVHEDVEIMQLFDMFLKVRP